MPGGSLQTDAIELNLLAGELTLEPMTLAPGGDLEVRVAATNLLVDSTTMGLSDGWRSRPVNVNSLTARRQNGRWSGELSATTSGWQVPGLADVEATLRCALLDDTLQIQELRVGVDSASLGQDSRQPQDQRDAQQLFVERMAVADGAVFHEFLAVVRGQHE